MELTRKKIIEDACNDLKDFFADGYAPTFRLDFDGTNPKSKATMIGSGSSSILRFFCYFSDEVCSSKQDFMYTMIFFGHEMAHLLNRHNDHDDQDNLDSYSIELWADHYGMKLIMCLLYYGERTFSNFRQIEDSESKPKFLNYIVRGLDKIVTEEIYDTDHESYPSESDRINMAIAGVNSFLDFHLGLNINRSLNVISTFYSNDILKKKLLIGEPNSDKIHDVSSRFSEIHQKIQGHDIAITKHLHPIFMKYIGTSYNSSPEERQQLIQDRLGQLSSLPGSEDIVESLKSHFIKDEDSQI